MRIDHINFNVSNLNNSVKFYSDLFGLEVKESGESQRGTSFAIIGHPQRFYMCLYENPKSVKQSGFNHFGVSIDRFEDFIAVVNQKNVKVLYGGEHNWPKSRSLYIQGPDGEEIEITEKFGGDLN